MSDAAGLLIAFEGGEGAGKSTQIRLLDERLRASGRKTILTREPGGTRAGAALRALLLTEQNLGWCTAAETLLMVADRAQHLAEVIEPALKRGEIVLTDRFVYSTLAYQGAGRGVDPVEIRDLHRKFCGDRWPDVTFVLDVDPALGLARSKRRLAAEGTAENRFEELDLDFHHRVRAAFLSFAAGDPAVVLIDAGGSPQQVADAIGGHPVFG